MVQLFLRFPPFSPPQTLLTLLLTLPLPSPVGTGLEAERGITVCMSLAAVAAEKETAVGDTEKHVAK
jgi:hypothetical protein